jgi:2-dehydro-3-deoxygluconokinase
VAASDDHAPALDVIALGEPLLEFNQRTGDDGEPVYAPGFGGDTSNFAVAAARQGATVGYLTRLGADTFGDRFVDLWRREGIDAQGVPRDPDAATGIYFISHDASGHHFTYFRAGSAASRMRPDDLPLDRIAAARVLHVSGISQAISTSACDAVFAAIAAARAAGVLVSYDPNVRLKLWPVARARAIVLETAGMADYCLPSLEDATTLLGEASADALADALLARGAGCVALKLGRDGVLVATAEERRRVPGFAVETVDATGAGDTFDGAFVSEMLRGSPLVAAARYANAAAALSTQGYGAVEPIPRRDEVERFLRSRDDAGAADGDRRA